MAKQYNVVQSKKITCNISVMKKVLYFKKTKNNMRTYTNNHIEKRKY